VFDMMSALFLAGILYDYSNSFSFAGKFLMESTLPRPPWPHMICDDGPG